MVVGLVVAPHRPFTDVAQGESTRHPVYGYPAAGHLVIVVIDERVVHVGNEVRRPDGRAIAAGRSAIIQAGKIVFAAIVKVEEIVGAIEDVIELPGRTRV